MSFLNLVHPQQPHRSTESWKGGNADTCLKKKKKKAPPGGPLWHPDSLTPDSGKQSARSSPLRDSSMQQGASLIQLTASYSTAGHSIYLWEWAEVQAKACCF